MFAMSIQELAHPIVYTPTDSRSNMDMAQRTRSSCVWCVVAYPTRQPTECARTEPLAPPTPPIFLQSLSAHGTNLSQQKDAEHDTDSIPTYDVHVPVVPEWCAVAHSRTVTIVDDFPVDTSCDIQPDERKTHGASPRDEVQMARAIYQWEMLAFLVLHGAARHQRASDRLGWYPHWACVNSESAAERLRLLVACTALSFSELKEFTVRMPVTRCHVQRWLDLLWALSPVWAINQPRIVLQLQGPITQETVQMVLHMVTTEPGLNYVSAPFTHPSWSSTFVHLLSCLHVELHPTHTTTELRSMCSEWVKYVRSSTFLASLSIVEPAWLVDDATPRCPASRPTAV